MYLSAERVALVNQTIRTTFEQTCVAWQAIPHWDTGDPGQTQVANEGAVPFVNIQSPTVPLTLTLAELIAPTPDAVLTKITNGVVSLAAQVDDFVFPQLRNNATGVVNLPALTPVELVNGLITARAGVENAGFRAPTGLFTDLTTFQIFHQLTVSYVSAKEPLLDAGNTNSLHRINQLGPAPAVPPNHHIRAILLGRRQRIAPGKACEASPGEEPVDLAVSIPPSFELVGETTLNNIIKINLRIRYAVRPKTSGGLAIITSP